MKCNPLLLISIALLGGAISQKSTGASPALSAAHMALLPNFVKHNQGIGSPTPSPSGTPNTTQASSIGVAGSTPTINVQLQSNSDKTMYIQYTITDCGGKAGDPHSKNTNSKNEDPTSSLFATTFPAGGDVMVMLVDGEVLIVGIATDGKCHAWKSDSKIYCDSDMTDLDVRWKPVDCF